MWVLVTLVREGNLLRGFSFSHAGADRWHALHPAGRRSGQADLEA